MYVLDHSVQSEFTRVGITDLCTYTVSESEPAPSGGGVHCGCDIET